MAIEYRTAATLNGFLADREDSLAWLFAVPGHGPDLAPFMEGVTVLVVGSTTYEWVLREESLIEHPEKWAGYFGSKPMFVFSSRALPMPEGADVRVVNGPVETHLPAIRAAAGDGDIWVQGGGDLAGQFIDAGALDAIQVTVAPVCLTDGRPLLPRDLLWDKLRLRSVEQAGEYAALTYDVTP